MDKILLLMVCFEINILKRIFATFLCTLFLTILKPSRPFWRGFEEYFLRYRNFAREQTNHGFSDSDLCKISMM